MGHHHDNKDHGDLGGGDLHHILAARTSRRTLIVLLLLTIVTVAVSKIHFGTAGNFAVAMFIASVKACIVTLFFMGMKYDSNENRAIFYSSIIFIAIFIILTGADIFTRHQGWRVGTQNIMMATKAVGGPDIKRPWESSPEILTHGKTLFETNCAVCHGAQGFGDGPGSNLPIKPRNFHEAAGWKNARRPSDIFKMLDKGIPPFMPAYGQLSPVDRWALTHYVLAFGPPPEADDAKTLGTIGIDPSKEDGGLNKGPVQRHIPVDFAIDRYVQKAQ